MRVVLADDEPLALQGLLQMMGREPDIEIVGIARDGPEALQLATLQSPDIIFLDMQMPGLSGLEVVAALGHAGAPDVVFVTAYDSYAVEAFSLDAVDYLLKPLQPDRLRQSLARARRRQAGRGAYRTIVPSAAQSSLHVPDRHGGTDIAQADIVWIEAAKDYGLIHTERRSHMVRTTMVELAERLDSHIMRVHRSAFVALPRVQEIQSPIKGSTALKLEDGTSVQVGPSYVKAVRSALHDLRGRLK